MVPPSIPELLLIRLGLPEEDARLTCVAAADAWRAFRERPRTALRGFVRGLLVPR